MSSASKNPPHGVIAKAIKMGTVVPFLGAGVNFGARPPDAKWDFGAAFLPNGKELSTYFAQQANLTSDDPRDIEDLAKVASYYVDVTGERETLRDDLRGIFNRQYTPCSIHTYLAEEAMSYLDGFPAYYDGGTAQDGDLVSRPMRGTPLLIVTTNYDDLIEKAFQKLNRPYDLVIYPTDRDDLANAVLCWKDRGHEGTNSRPTESTPNGLSIDFSKTNVIYKMHGSIDRIQPRLDSFVITEEDYVDFLSRLITRGAIPAQIMECFSRRRFLFLGYGLKEWNLRVVLRNLRSVLPAQSQAAPPGNGDPLADLHPDANAANAKSWAIQYQPSDLETALWRARRVDIYDQDVNVFAERLRQIAPTLPSAEDSV